ncbi:MAG: cupin domain-containing protein [Polyangiales bacterium]
MAEAAFPEGESQLVRRADAITWVRCPPSLPAPCEMAVLEGDPKTEMMFTVRFRTGSAFEMKPHWHPRNERVTILEGRVGVGFGDQIDRENVTWFGPGDYYVNAEGAHHFVLTDGPAVLQITGIGPWKANFL